LLYPALKKLSIVGLSLVYPGLIDQQLCHPAAGSGPNDDFDGS
jgi:hypothetical protein